MSGDAKTAEESKGDQSTRGIPTAKFIEDVEDHCSKVKGSADAVLKELYSLYGKYKFMETNLIQQKKSLLIKIPDIKTALETLQYLIKKQEQKTGVSTHFELADNLYAKATITEGNTVLLWLGANVMVEYEYKEALALLTKNLENAEKGLASLEQDIAFLKDQITISEVNVARVHNHRVEIRKQLKASGAVVPAS